MHKIILFNKLIPDAVTKFIKDNACENPRFDKSLLEFIESHEMITENDFNSARAHLDMINDPNRLIGVKMQTGPVRYYGYHEEKGSFCYVRIGEYTYNSYKRPVLIEGHESDELTTLDQLYLLDEKTKLYCLNTKSQRDDSVNEP